MGQDPEQIRDEIERTRQDMGDTVGAIGYKTDVKSRTRDKVTETKDKITGRAEGLRERVTGTVSSAGESVQGTRGRVSSATPDADEVKYKARRAKSVAQQNPLGLALGSAAVGFLAGMLIPTTELEDEKIGPIADQIREEAKSTGQEALERGKHVAQQAQEAAVTAVQSGDEAKGVGNEASSQVQGLKDSVRESAQNVQSTAQRTTSS